MVVAQFTALRSAHIMSNKSYNKISVASYIVAH